jgi:hypothetical protein
MTTQEMIENTLHNIETLKGMKQALLNGSSSWGSIQQVQNEIKEQVQHLETLQATLKSETIASGKVA